MRCVLPGRKIASRAEFCDELARRLRLPAHFGRNLDALWDVLTGDLPGPVEIVWREASRSRRSMGAKEHDKLVGLLLDAAAERDDVRVVIES